MIGDFSIYLYEDSLRFQKLVGKSTTILSNLPDDSLVSLKKDSTGGLKISGWDFKYPNVS